jgi:Big-like domain-containing protein/WD40 repeat protein
MRRSSRTGTAVALALAFLSCSDSSGPEVGIVPARITLLSGVTPTGYVAGTKIATPVVIQVTDAAGLPVPNVELAFNTTGGGWVSPELVTTDREGKAYAYWNLGREAGPNSLLIFVASSPSIPSVEITTSTIPGAVAFLFMGPPAATLAKGSTLQLVATAADANFNAVPGTAISWVSSNETAVSVSLSGLLTAAAPGNATIGATANAASAYATVTVPVPAGPSGPGIPPFTMAISANGDNGISIVRSDGTVESRIACGTQCSYLGGPNWSRDGSKLAVTGRRDTLSVLFVVNRDGTNLHEVASAPRLFISPPTNSAYWTGFGAAWSTDGRLVYVRSSKDGNAIETVAADGTGRSTVMAPTNPIRTLADLNTGNPRWGLGDSMISAEIGNQIYSMNPDGSNLRQLTSVTSGAFGHKWSPDGKTIAFSTIAGFDQGMISILDPVSRALRQIIAPRFASFCWSPNGSQLSLVSLENELQGWKSIYTVNVDGTALQRAVMAITGMGYTGSAWSPDERFLVYLDDRRFAGGPVGAQLYAQSLSEGTNTRLGDFRDLTSFSVAEVRGC